MSEKRFFTSLADEEYTLIQKKGNLRATYLKYSEVVELLNELSEENEQLKQSNDRFADTVAKQVSLLIELRKENEQLRQILKDIVMATDETYTKNTSMFKVTAVLDYEKYMEIRRCIK